LAADHSGNLYVATKPTVGNKIFKIDSAGYVQYLAGVGVMYKSNCPGVESAVLALDLAVDGKGDVYFVDGIDKGAHIIRKLDPQGMLTIAAGSWDHAQQRSGDGGPAAQAGLGSLVALAADAQGQLYILDNAATIRKVDTNGIINTVVTQAPLGRLPSGYSSVYHMYTDAGGNLYYSAWADDNSGAVLLYSVNVGTPYKVLTRTPIQPIQPQDPKLTPTKPIVPPRPKL
jgi:hypothetical protein